MQGDFIERNDDRLYSGYGSCLLVDEKNDGFYSLVIPSESVPAVEGEYETFEYNSLLSRVKSKVKGKRELSDATMEFTYSRENVLRLDELVNKTLNFMRFNPNFTYETYTAEISYAMNDSEADILKGTLNIVPSSLGAKGIDGRDKIRQTLEFSGTVPDEVVLDATTKTKDVTLAVKQADANATFDVTVEGSSKITATVTGGKLTITADSTLTNDAYAMVLITAKSATKMTTEGNEDKDKYAPYTMTIAVAYTA